MVDTPQPPDQADNGSREFYEDQLTIGNAAALDNIQRDRCLLRRQTRLVQNQQYKLGKEDKDRAAKEMCEEGDDDEGGDGMHVEIDRSHKVIHNHNEGGHPKIGRFPWWLIVLLILPLILLVAILIGWLLHDDPRPPIGWQLDIDSQDPAEVQPAEPNLTPLEIRNSRTGEMR